MAWAINNKLGTHVHSIAVARHTLTPNSCQCYRGIKWTQRGYACRFDCLYFLVLAVLIVYCTSCVYIVCTDRCTSWSTKHAILFLNITPVILLKLFYINRNRNEYETYKICNVVLAVLNCSNVIYSSGWPWPTASCSAFEWNGCAQLSQKVVLKCFFFSIFVKEFRVFGQKNF